VGLIINDRVDVALAVGADGVHVGQDDIPAKLARDLLGPNKILGVSVKTVQQAQQAAADGADYLGAGASKPCTYHTLLLAVVVICASYAVRASKSCQHLRECQCIHGILIMTADHDSLGSAEAMLSGMQ